MDLAAIIARMQQQGDYRTIATSPGMQFGTAARPFLGATLLPERPQVQNVYYEEAIRFRSIIASDNTRYSPPVKKNGDLLSSMLVELGEADIARELSGQIYDTLQRLMMGNQDMEAMATLLGWNGTALIQGLLEFNERQRWQAIVGAQVPIVINGTTKTVQYLDPAGARFNAGGTWSSDVYDPFDDIGAAVASLADAGYPAIRAITSTKVATILSRNAKVAQRAGRIVLAGGNLSVQDRVTASRADINAQLAAEGWPAIETYDRKYHTETGAERYFADTVMILIGETGQTAEIALDDDNVELSLENVLGYVGVGVPAGETQPGRVVRNWYHDDKPPRVEAQAWQTSLSVITAPEAIRVIKAIS